MEPYSRNRRSRDEREAEDNSGGGYEPIHEAATGLPAESCPLTSPIAAKDAAEKKNDRQAA